VTQETDISGYIYADGRLSVAAHSNYTVYALGSTVLTADATVRVQSQGTIASSVLDAWGSLVTPIGRADVSGAIYTNGDYYLTGTIQVDIGDSSNYMRGDAAVSYSKIGFNRKLRVEGTLDAQLKNGSFRAKGSVSGWIERTYGLTSISLGAGLHYSGKVEVYDGVFSKSWKTLGSIDVAMEVQGNAGFTLHTAWADFSLSLG
jgi:hypothetical protein